jgi:putative flippase GtrA
MERGVEMNHGEKSNNLRKEILRSLKFGLFSISAGIIEIAAFTLLNELTNWRYWPCYLLALTLSVLWNFTLNRRYTFQSANNIPIATLKVLGFYCVFTPASTILGDYLADTLLWNEYLVTLLIMLSNFVLEFLYDRFFVFRKSIDTNKLARRK